MPFSDETSPKGVEWTYQEVLQLIKEYGERPSLWNTQCVDYKNKYKKHQDWMELASIFNCNKLEVERKMKILNSQYRRERVKAIKMRKAGLPHKVTWYGYKSFSFLHKHYLRTRSKDSLCAVKEEEQEEEERPYVGANEVLEPGDESNKESESTQQDGGIKMALERDEWAVFGELIAHGMRKLPDDRTRCIVKHKINTALYEAELASYEHFHSAYHIE